MNVMEFPVANAWNTVTANLNQEKWNLYGQAANGNWVGLVGAAPPNGGYKTLAAWQADPTWGPVLFGPGGSLTSVQFGLGSSQRAAALMFDYLQTTLLNGGDPIDFQLPVENVTQHTYFATIQAAVDAATAGDVLLVNAGTYDEDVAVNKALTITGAGIDQSIVRGVMGSVNPQGATFQVQAEGVTLEGFTITRNGNNPTDWDSNLNSAGVAVQTVGTATIRNNKFTGNRTAIDINDSDGNVVYRNVIDFNRTGLVFRNACLNNVVEENAITNNWTVGILWLNFSNEDAAGCRFSKNSIEGNWYCQIENRNAAPPLYLKDFSGNWLGDDDPDKLPDRRSGARLLGFASRGLRRQQHASGRNAHTARRRTRGDRLHPLARRRHRHVGRPGLPGQLLDALGGRQQRSERDWRPNSRGD